MLPDGEGVEQGQEHGSVTMGHFLYLESFTLNPRGSGQFA